MITSAYKYQLDTSSRKYRCPACGKMRLVRFIDVATGQYLPDEYGRCDREVNCGHFLKPEKRMEITSSIYPSTWKAPFPKNQAEKPVLKLPVIPWDVLKQSLSSNDENMFVTHLVELFDKGTAQELINRYYIGSSSSRWPGATVFWFVDQFEIVRSGQVKLFDRSGHTVKHLNPNGEVKTSTTWIHTVIEHLSKRNGQSCPSWVKDIANYTGSRVSCLFGEHLLMRYPAKPVAVVEAPATAIVASIYLPSFVWLATGSLSYLTLERCKALKGRNVYLFPDLSKDGKAFDLWNEKAKELRSLAHVNVSDYLEQHATGEERSKGLDLRDFLTRFNYLEFMPTPLRENSPLMIVIDGKSLQIICLICQLRLGVKFKNAQIVTFRLNNGKVCEILLDTYGLPLNRASSFVLVDSIEIIFKKSFVNYNSSFGEGLLHWNLK